MTEAAAHRRFNPLRGEWVLVSPHRSERPWQGRMEAASEAPPRYDPSCYLCPGNARANGARNPPYATTFAFDNDFPALLPDTIDGAPSSSPLLSSAPERGLCRVVCFSPRHDLTLSQMEPAAIRSVIDAWIGECAALAEVPWASYATVFENRGEMMGASNPHPHCQIWTTEHVPDEPARERASLAKYQAERGSCLLCDYMRAELADGTRLVCANDRFVAVVPYWAVWPFETIVISRQHVPALGDLDDTGRDGLAAILKQLTTRYDKLFETPFPYSMGFHQALRSSDGTYDHLHAHFYPPLLRSATVRKYMVGFELLGSPQRDLTPEAAAKRLQAVR